MGLARRALLTGLLLCALSRHFVVPQAVDTANDAGDVITTDTGAQHDPGEEYEAAGVNFKFRGREWHPEHFGYTQCSAPTPRIDARGNIFGCRILHDVCVDQGVIIYQDSRYHPWTSESRLPQFNITDILWNTPSVLGIGDKWKIGKNRYQFPLMRPWHHMEESDDVRRPVFSNCTTPLLFFHHFPFNVAEVYRFAVNNIYFMQQRLKFFDNHITLVPGSPPMSAVPSFTRFWLQPFSSYAVTSLGALSQRWPAGSPPPPSAATGEGVQQRCFSRFIMCKITLKKPTGAYFEAGQFVADYYAKKNEPMEANYTARLAAKVPLGDQTDDAVLKVVFAVRSKSHKDIGRVLLNEDDLIERCNRGELKLPQNRSVSIFRNVRCFSHIFGVDNLYDMWLMRRTDVLVGVHGSALTNAEFMREGSSLIELRPHGFSGRESWPNIYMKSQTRGLEVFWYGIDVMSANLSTPGDFERDMQNIYTRAKGCLARDRNLIVPWEAIAHQLANVAVVSRSVWRYKVLRYSHAYYITHDIKPLELPGKDRRVPEIVQSWFTDPDEERHRAAAIPLTPEGERRAHEAEEQLLRKAAEAEQQARQAAEEAEAAKGNDAEAQGGEGGGGGAGAEGNGGGDTDAEQGGSQEGHPHLIDSSSTGGAAEGDTGAAVSEQERQVQDRRARMQALQQRHRHQKHLERLAARRREREEREAVAAAAAAKEAGGRRRRHRRAR